MHISSGTASYYLRRRNFWLVCPRGSAEARFPPAALNCALDLGFCFVSRALGIHPWRGRCSSTGRWRPSRMVGTMTTISSSSGRAAAAFAALAPPPPSELRFVALPHTPPAPMPDVMPPSRDTRAHLLSPCYSIRGSAASIPLPAPPAATSMVGGPHALPAAALGWGGYRIRWLPPAADGWLDPAAGWAVE